MRVAVLGLSFKPGTSDVRESPAFPIIRELLSLGATVKAYDPVAMDEAQKVLPELKGLRCASLDSAVAEIDAVVVVTPWKHFHDLPALLRNRNPAVVFVDGRRAFDPAELRKLRRDRDVVVMEFIETRLEGAFLIRLKGVEIIAASSRARGARMNSFSTDSMRTWRN